jgi:hypothetical protein
LSNHTSFGQRPVFALIVEKFCVLTTSSNFFPNLKLETAIKATKFSKRQINSMNTEEEARELMVQHRQHKDHQKEAMSTRTEAEIETPIPEYTGIQEESRELMVEQRQKEEHQTQTMLNRTGEEVGITSQ